VLPFGVINIEKIDYDDCSDYVKVH